MAIVHGVHGDEQVETYLVNIALPNRVMFTGIPVTRAKLKDADILIGMDIITQGDFAVTNYNGRTMFSFRMPSLGHIDFVPEINKIVQPPLNRAERRRRERDRR